MHRWTHGASAGPRARNRKGSGTGPVLRDGAAAAPSIGFYGQEAKLKPLQTGDKVHCGGKDVVGSAWIGLPLPYCADPRHAPDTKLFIVEQDWRLYPEDLEVNLESPDGTG